MAVDIACIGNRLLAIAWLDKVGDATRARLLILDRDLVPLPSGVVALTQSITPAVTNGLQNLGLANAEDGISVAATGNRVFLAWSKGARHDLQMKRFNIGSGADPTITPRPTERIAVRDAIRPKLAARGQKLVLAYSDDGKLKARVSGDAGGSLSPATVLLQQGTVNVPSFATSTSLSGKRIVIEAMKKQPNSENRDYKSVRIQSQNVGVDWGEPAEFGNRGVRLAALRKVDNSESRINEAWHDDGPSIDVLRAQREVAGG